MRFVIQRVKEASVQAEQEVIGEIKKGYLVLIGVSDSDTEQVADRMIKKMIGLRIFEDENGNINNSQAGAGTGCGILNVSQNKTGGWEYEYTISAADGAILDYERDD